MGVDMSVELAGLRAAHVPSSRPAAATLTAGGTSGSSAWRTSASTVVVTAAEALRLATRRTSPSAATRARVNSGRCRRRPTVLRLTPRAAADSTWVWPAASMSINRWSRLSSGTFRVTAQCSRG